jgi:hypothetical protein
MERTTGRSVSVPGISRGAVEHTPKGKKDISLNCFKADYSLREFDSDTSRRISQEYDSKLFCAMA